MNRGAPRAGGAPYRSRQPPRPAYRNRQPGRTRPPPASTKPKGSKTEAARKGARRIPSIIGIVASIIPLVDWVMEKISPKVYRFKVNDKVIFQEDTDDLDLAHIPIYRITKLGTSSNTYNLWDPVEKRIVAEDVDGDCLQKVSHHRH